MHFFQDIPFTRSDFVKFVLLSTIFSIAFFAYNNAYSPVLETTYNSASILSQEQKVIELFWWWRWGVDADGPLEAPKETTSLLISFRPEHITIDDELLENIREVAKSEKFVDKVSPLHLIIDTLRKEPRGQVSGNSLILSGKIASESESLKVLVHELGHIIDIYYLPLHESGDDFSNKFYTISWQDYNVKKRGAKLADFVSGYALSNKYEDFAESFAFFVFHNEEFVRRSIGNDSLKEKYEFFANNIFQNREFFSTNFASDKIRSYNWDVTKIPVNIKKYLYYIK